VLNDCPSLTSFELTKRGQDVLAEHLDKKFPRCEVRGKFSMEEDERKEICEKIGIKYEKYEEN
jgi:hypothetical protein